MKINDIETQRIKRDLSLLVQCKSTRELISSLVFNGRVFSIRKLGERDFYPFELTPTGILFNGGDSSKPKNFNYEYRNILTQTFQKNPNSFSGFCESQNIDLYSVCRVGGKHSPGTMYCRSLEEAIVIIINAIKENVVIKLFKT